MIQSNMETVAIASLQWSIKNLDVMNFANGDPIPEAKTNEEWMMAGEQRQAAWCYYENDSSNGEKYGKIYNWYAVNDPRGLAPSGWRVPSDEEWTLLSEILGGDAIAGIQLKFSEGWEDNGSGTNESGFSGLPGGIRGMDGKFDIIGKLGLWWSSSEEDESSAWGRDLAGFHDLFHRLHAHKATGLSIRRIRN